MPWCRGEVTEENASLEEGELTKSGMERVFLSFLGPMDWEINIACFPGDVSPFLNMDWGRNVCMLIRERRFALGEVEGSLDLVLTLRSSTSTAEAAGAPRSRGLQTQ